MQSDDADETAQEDYFSLVSGTRTNYNKIGGTKYGMVTIARCVPVRDSVHVTLRRVFMHCASE